MSTTGKGSTAEASAAVSGPSAPTVGTTSTPYARSSSSASRRESQPPAGMLVHRLGDHQVGQAVHRPGAGRWAG